MYLENDEENNTCENVLPMGGTMIVSDCAITLITLSLSNVTDFVK